MWKGWLMLWVGQDDSNNTVETWKNLRDTQQLWQYLYNQGGKLRNLIPNNKRREDGIYYVMT